MPTEKTINVVVADDNPCDLLVLEEVMKNTPGVQGVTAVTDGQKAIDEFYEKYGSEAGYKIVITDMEMPQSDGVEVLESVKQKSPETRVYIVTGTPDLVHEALKERGYTSRPEDIIEKPADVQQLRGIVNNH